MNRPALPPLRPALATALAAALALAAAAAHGQTWEYKSYKKDRGTGQYDKERFNVGEISLAQKDGKSYFHMIAGAVDACLKGDIPADVTKTDATTTIELQQSLAGCEPVRYVIRDDGSGGERQVKRGDRWVKDGFDHGLTPKP